MFIQMLINVLKFLKVKLELFQKIKILSKIKTTKLMSILNNNNSYFKSVLPMLRFQLKLGEKFNVSPIVEEHFLAKSKNSRLNFKVKLVKSKRVLNFIKFHSIFMFIYLLICKMRFSGYYKNIGIPRLMLSLFFLIGVQLFNLTRAAVLNYSKDMVKLLNALKNFEDTHIEGYFIK